LLATGCFCALTGAELVRSHELSAGWHPAAAGILPIITVAVAELLKKPVESGGGAEEGR